jgi:endoglucanase
MNATMNAIRRRLAIAAALLALIAGPVARGHAPESRREGPALHNMLPHKEMWRAYKGRFVTGSGRVVDTANGGVSHSEGQGYGMLLAVAADDRAGFEAIWGWTRANLFVRGDELAAWRWEPEKRPAIADMNNATDGDLLIAWALTEAAEAWGDVSHRVAARRIAVEIGRKLILLKTANGSLLLPGMAGFAAEDRADGPVLNLSYYVFPAFARLPLVAAEFDWAGLSRAGLRLIEKARFGPARLPSDWVSLKTGEPQPADGFPAQFSYNAIRIPLYLAWAGFDQPRHHDGFLAAWEKGERRGLPLIDLAQGQPALWLEERGYGALPALSACASRATTLPRALRSAQAGEHYYPATLSLLALTAARMRYPSCLRD